MIMRSPAPALTVRRARKPSNPVLNALLTNPMAVPDCLRDLAPDLEAAVAASGGASASSGMRAAWKLWARFCSPRGIPVTMRKRDPLRLTALAAFKVAMVNGKVPPRVGGTPKRYAAASADVYVSSITQIHSIREPAALFKRVTSGIKTLRGKDKRAVCDLSLHQITTMVVYAMDDKCTCLRTVRNAYVHLYLLFSMSRSEAAVAKTMVHYDPEWDLSNSAVEVLPCNTAIKYTLKHGKSRALGHRPGPDGSFPIFIAGKPGTPLDPVALHSKYLRLRGSATATDPFFVQVAAGKSTGRVFTYSAYLKELRLDIKRHFPQLTPSDYGTHMFRRLSATLCLMKRLPTDLLKLTGQWTSASYERYFNLDDEQRAAVAHFVSGAPVAKRLKILPATAESDAARSAFAFRRQPA